MDRSVKGLIIGLLAVLPVAYGVFWGDYLEMLEIFVYHRETSWSVGVVRISLWIALAALVWRVYLVYTYRPAAACTDQELPLCSVIVPAYNEGAQVLYTLRSVAASDYPVEKLQIITVDDGSKDDTWRWMKQAERELGDRVELIRLAENSGKRRALYEGFQRSRGDILVTIDSDSEVDASTLRHLVSPFVRDPMVGGVAGNVRVLNTAAGIIPKMLDVSFTFSFDFIRASQSRVNTVMTTPGALSAYRRSVVGPVLKQWLHQTFFGQPANIGEDRALTNLILKNGYHVHFAKNAVVYTEVPTAYMGLAKMFLRWARSNVRETIVMAKFIFKRFRRTPALGARINLLLHLHRMTIGEILKIWSLTILAAFPTLFFFNMVTGAILFSMIPGLFYLSRHKDSNFLWAIPYSLFWLIGLSWISLYALFTPHRTGWLTRDLKSQANPLLAPAAQKGE
ncbi:glycosyltransferase family 2 protein [Desulfococcus multivorans]|uniref:Glycosyl transferase family 2 n=3 Tax=Desulfococcus multivorans TaxID=897 RepID=S7TPJ7_DESML|nr:glycosyltransferase family 2 protein [Desulfococcus multivorans]EPR38841.1 glycosyl transferase family 2 [Desulfococcus multivorans DSM 2059]